MRWLVALIIIALLAMYLWPEPAPVPAEESFIKEPVKALRKAENVEADHLKATQERQKQMEKQLEEDTGGGD